MRLCEHINIELDPKDPGLSTRLWWTVSARQAEHIVECTDNRALKFAFARFLWDKLYGENRARIPHRLTAAEFCEADDTAWNKAGEAVLERTAKHLPNDIVEGLERRLRKGGQPACPTLDTE